MGDDVLKLTRDEGVGIGPESGLKDLLQRSTIEESPGGAQGSRVMGPNWANTKRVLTGELNTLYEPSRDGVLGGSSVRSSGSDEKVRGGTKLTGTFEIPLQSLDWASKLVLRNRGKGGKRGKENFHRPRRSSLILGYKEALGISLTPAFSQRK